MSRSRQVSPFVALVLAAALLMPVVAHSAESPVFFRAAFDGAPDAQLDGAALPPTQAEKLEFAESDGAKALRLGDAARLEYELGQGFPAEAGAIEVRFKPNFPQSPEQPERTVFSLTGPAAESIAFSFHPQGTRWRFALQFPKLRREVTAHYFNPQNEKRWNHLVMVWGKQGGAAPTIQFYRDGKLDRSRTEAYDGNFRDLQRLVIGGKDLSTSIDELVIYRRVLTPAEVLLLSSRQDEARFTALQELHTREQKVITEQKQARHALTKQLDGKVAYLINPRGAAQRDMTLPEGIHAHGLRVEDVGQVDLKQFAVIYGPPGGAYQLTPEQDRLIHDYVAAGGGYVGVCAGANYASKAQLVPMTTHSFRNQGLITVEITPHPITEGYTDSVVVHHGNGPIMIPGDGCQVVGKFSIGQHFPITTAAICTSNLGKGRAVAFGPHPTGGGVKSETKGVQFSGSELGTEKLLVNALLWAAGLPTK